MLNGISFCQGAKVINAVFDKSDLGHFCRCRCFGCLTLLPVVAAKLTKTNACYGCYEKPISDVHEWVKWFLGLRYVSGLRFQVFGI